MPSSKRYKEYTHLLGMFLLFLVRLEDVKKLFVHVRDIRKFGLYLVQVLDRAVELLLYGILILILILVVQVPKKRRGRIRLRTLVKPRRKIRIELRNMGEVVSLWDHRTRAERRQ